MRRTIALLLFVIPALLAARAVAQAPAPALPDLTVTALDGTVVTSATLRQPEKWLLVYVHPQSESCGKALAALKPDGDTPTEAEASLLRRTVLVVGATVDDAKQLRDAFPYLAQANWYADPDHAAFGRLKLQGVPVVLGLRADGMMWRMNGVLPDQADMRAILRSW